MEDAGFYGMGIEYAKAMLGENIGGLYSYRRNWKSQQESDVISLKNKWKRIFGY